MPTHEEILNEIAAKNYARYQAIEENLPSWSEIDTAITNATTITALKVIIRKMARVVYWLAKNRGD